jgi:cardiolipin synthase
MWTEISLVYPLLVTAASFVVALFVSAHVVLYKRDVRAAIGWVGVIWLTPFIGSFLYLSFGINRVNRKARKLYAGVPPSQQPAHTVADQRALERTLASHWAHLESLVEYVDRITDRRLLQGNSVRPFETGDDAYRAMLAAIGEAQRSISLSTYIFDNDAAGKLFVDALAAARQRGVEIRVLIDDVGARYTFPSVRHSLRAAGIPNATFFPTLIPWTFHYSNLRNHRKLLVVDGLRGFTGGMNIRAGHMASLASKYPIQDTHFELAGPVVRHLQETFASDWEFVTGEDLEGDIWFPEIPFSGDCLARGIAAGPEGHGDKIRLALMGALACAKKSVVIMTPYFLPDPGLVSALNTADLRGVDVRIILPATNNLALVQWASTAMLWQVLERGVQVWLSSPPFDHTKLMIVDGCWTLFGSANWDPRSLRLNFEFNVECYSEAFARQMTEHAQKKLATARQVTLEDVDGRKLPMRLRDGIARLLTPYL